MVTIEHFADDTGALAMLLARVEAHLAHRIENAPLHRFEAVAHVGQRARSDNGHRIREIALSHFVFDVDLMDKVDIHAAWAGSGSFANTLELRKCAGAFVNRYRVP